jgi:hypothetical protein
MTPPRPSQWSGFVQTHVITMTFGLIALTGNAATAIVSGDGVVPSLPSTEKSRETHNGAARWGLLNGPMLIFIGFVGKLQSESTQYQRKAM